MYREPARCSEGQAGDQAMRGVHRGDKAIAEISASVLSVEWRDHRGRTHSSAGWGLPMNMSEIEAAVEKAVQHTDKANSNNLLGAMAFVQES